ncbi:MAG: M16 family metallopeptidase [Patescibacteria group bacterium]
MFTTHTLNNGMRVIVSPLRDTKAVTVLIMVKVGSRYETRQINGVSHFVEHLMFKGTTKRPTALMITKELDGIGAEYNAFTSKDVTGYYIKAHVDTVDLLLDMLADMLQHSIFNQKEIERERGVIIEEINMYEDNPMMMMEDVFEQAMWGDHPLGWNIAGPKSVIQKVTRQQLLDYYHTYYVPANMIVTIAGNVQDAIVDRVAELFAPKRARTVSFPFRKIGGVQDEPHVVTKQKETEQVQLGLGFPAYPHGDKRLYPLYLLNVVLGGNMSSRLFMSIREKKGLCYFIRTSVNPYQDTGAFMVQAGLDKRRINEAISAILAELKKVRQHGVTSAELKKAREFLKGKLILDLEASDQVAAWLGRQLLFDGKIKTPAEQIRLLERVNTTDLIRVAKDLFRPRRLNLALIGPVGAAEAFSRLLRL